MKVYVVARNDFPHSVYAKEVDAKAVVQAAVGSPHIYWRMYGFDVIESQEAEAPHADSSTVRG